MWERLSLAKHDWVVPVLFQGVEAGVANHLNLNKSGIVRWLDGSLIGDFLFFIFWRLSH